MKKIIFLVLICLTIFLTSCNENHVTCDEKEEYLDGVCQLIQTPFEQTFDRMIDLDNYTLNVTIQQFADLYTILMKVDGDKASFDIDGMTEFYHYEDNLCRYYYPVGAGYRMEMISCESTSSYDFFHSFEATWFTEVSGKYFLKTEYYDEVSILFQTKMEGSHIANMELVVGDLYFEKLIFDVFVGDLSYRFEMMFDQIGSTVITLPAV